MKLHVRAADARDVETVARFQASMAMESENRVLDTTTLHAGITHACNCPNDGRCLVAEANGTVCGCMLITFEWSDWRNGRFWWIQSVYVDPSHRRNGVYRALHAEARRMATADPAGCGLRLYVERLNHGAQATYRRLGMSETGYRLFEEIFDDR